MVADSKCTTGFSDSVMKFNEEMGRCENISMVSYSEEISHDMVCASPPFGSKRGGPCQGDSGGPFTVRNSQSQHELVGITSWGYGCAEVRYQVNPQKYHIVFSGRPLLGACRSGSSKDLD